MEAERPVSVPPDQSGPSSQAVQGSQDGWPALAAGTGLLVGLLITIMGAAHLQGVLTVATRRSYPYDLRLAGLLLVGGTLVLGGVLCLSAVRGLARRRPSAWNRAMSGTLLLLLVLVLMSPLQPDMAPGLAVIAAVNAIALLGARRRLEAG